MPFAEQGGVMLPEDPNIAAAEAWDEGDVWSFLTQARPADGLPEWVHLKSGPRWGNTTLLENIAARFSDSPAFGSALVLLCRTLEETRGEVQPGLGAIGQCMFDRERERTARRIPHFRSRLKNTPGGHLALMLLKKAALAIAVIALTAYTGYLTQSEFKTLASYLTKGPQIWLLVGVGVLTWLGNRLLNMFDRDELAGPEPSMPSQQVLDQYRLVGGMTEKLAELTAGSTRLVLLIDDVHKIPKHEMYLLGNLGGVAAPPAAKAIQRRVRVQIVTIDPTQKTPVPPNAVVHSLAAPPLGTVEAARAPDGVEKSRQAMAQARSMLAMDQGGKQGGWGLLEMAGICAADAREARTESDWGKALSLRAGSAFSRHLEIEGITPPSGVLELLRRLGETSLFQRDGKSFRRDRRVAAALEEELRANYPDVLCQGHLFWLAYEAPPPEDESGGVYLHGLKAARVGGGAIQNFGVDRLVGALVNGARIWRENGEVDSAAEALARARNYLSREGQTPPSALVEDFASEWALLYAVAGLPAPDKEAAEPAALAASRSWAIHLQHRRFVCDAVLGGLLDDAGLRPEIANLNRYTNATIQQRSLGGSYAVHNPAYVIQDPVAGPLGSGSELSVYLFHAERAIARGEFQEFKKWMTQARDRLLQLRPSDGKLGLEAVWRLAAASYLETLQRWWKEEATKLGDKALGDKAEDAPSYPELRRTATELCLKASGDLEDLPTKIQAEFESCLALGNLLSLRPVALHATTELALLLRRTTADAVRQDDPDWWRGWDELLNAALAIEQDLGWLYEEPVILWNRWMFFKELDAPGAAWDGLLFYEAAIRANYPDTTLAAWNSEIRDPLTGTIVPTEANFRLAALWLDWARLVDHPEVRAGVLNPEREKASALLFAAQSYRLGGDYEKAYECLDRAHEVLRSQYGEFTSLPNLENQSERDLLMSFVFQCYWLQGAGVEIPFVDIGSGDIWRMLRPGDFHLMTALWKLLSDEFSSLPDGWLPGSTPFADPENPALQLVVNGMQAPQPPATRFEFRLRQLLGWLTDDSYCEPELVAGKARGKWAQFDHVTACIYLLAEAGLKILDIPHLDRLVIALLEEAYYQAVQVRPNDETERRALQWLIKYQRSEERWRTLYVKVCEELKLLFAREMERPGGAETVDYYKLVVLAQSHLEALEDPALRRVLDRDELRLSGQDERARADLLEKKNALRDRATGLLKKRAILDCWSLLQEFVEAPDSAVVALIDLELLGLARSCAELEPSLQVHRARLGRRLQRQAVRYVERFVATISDRTEKELARRLIKLLDRGVAAGASA